VRRSTWMKQRLRPLAWSWPQGPRQRASPTRRSQKSKLRRVAEMSRKRAEYVKWYLERSLPLLGLAALLGLLLALPAGAQQQVVPCASNVAHNSTACEITPSGVSTATESGRVVKTGGGILIAANLNNWNASAGVTVMALDAAAVPANGTLAVCSGVANANPRVMNGLASPARRRHRSRQRRMSVGQDRSCTF
jgi:hypothetical protein